MNGHESLWDVIYSSRRGVQAVCRMLALLADNEGFCARYWLRQEYAQISDAKNRSANLRAILVELEDLAIIERVDDDDDEGPGVVVLDWEAINEILDWEFPHAAT